ncbi:MAG TPA: hypothetical protein VIG80_02165 [Bacillaceae bacterium]
MFTLKDMGTFLWAMFLTLPLVALIHSAGHLFFAKLFGGKIRLILGRGKPLVHWPAFEIRLLYFVDSRCHYGKLRVDNRLTHCLVHAGGILFNVMSILAVNIAIYAGYLPKHLFFYQFVYFSVYYIFFALMPIQYGEGHYSDGLSILYIIKRKKPADIVD